MDSGNGIFGFVVLAIYAGVFLLWFWAIIDILRNDFKKDINKIIWLLVTIFVPIGFIIYLVFGRNQKEPKSKE